MPSADDTLTQPPGQAGRQPGTPPATGRRRDVSGTVLRGIGQTLITAGVVVLLFAVYEVWVTNYFADQRQAKVKHQIAQQWAQGNDLLALPGGELSAHAGQGIAQIYVPRLGADWAKAIVEGTADDDLSRGVGHYTNSQLPGQAGNFAVAGHRVSWGQPFLNADKIKPGDAIVVETATTWWVYCVLGTTDGNTCDPNAAGGSLDNRDANGVPGREIVSPSQGQVVLPVPSRPGAAQPYSTAYLTITTCTPKFSATQRMVIHAVLDPAHPQGIAKEKSGKGYSSVIPAPVQELYQRIGAI